MTAHEWLTSGAPAVMLNHCWPDGTARQKRLFGTACCHRAERLMSAEVFAALDGIEAFADRTISFAELRQTHSKAFRSDWVFQLEYLTSTDTDRILWVWQGVANLLLAAGAKWHDELAAIARLVRDVFENPFRPVEFDPAWRTDTAIAITRQMYESREFGAMPILADALQDAGCEDAAVLMHCRDANQPHVRGCWVCDLVLGKE